jgi:hypothetical protein
MKGDNPSNFISRELSQNIKSNIQPTKYICLFSALSSALKMPPPDSIFKVWPMNHIKRLGWHYLALLLLVILVILTLTWFYEYFQSHFGPETALVSLALILAGELIVIIWGAVHAHRIHRILREQADIANNPSLSDATGKPTLFKVFDMDLQPCAILSPIETGEDKVQQEIQKLLDTPKKHRGKQARFPLSQIRQAVLSWERRDPSFSAMTLDEFLGQQFGSGPDGILLMSPSTFYDWRRRILKELEDHRPPEPKVGNSPECPLSESSSPSSETIS